MDTLHEELVADRQWKWRRGIVLLPVKHNDPGVITAVVPMANGHDYKVYVHTYPTDMEGRFPDIEDDATKGVLLAMLREDLGNAICSYRIGDDGWWMVVDVNTATILSSDPLSEGRALAAARLATWKNERLRSRARRGTTFAERLYAAQPHIMWAVRALRGK